jgi:MFS family permease
MATVALPLIAIAVLHASAMGVGVLAALVWLPWLVVGLPAGAWVDRLPRRPILLACNAVSIVAYASVVEGLRFVVHDRYLRPMVSYAALVNFALMGYQAVQVVFLVRTVGAGSFAVGLLVAAGSAGGVVGALAVPFVGRRLGTARGLVLAQLVGGPFALLLPLTTPGPGLAFFAAGAFMVGAGITICNVMLFSFRQTYCPPRLLGRVVATTMVLNHSTIPLGALLGGLLAAQLGTRPAMWIMTAVLTPCGLILALSPLGRRRDLPTPARSSPVEPLPH